MDPSFLQEIHAAISLAKCYLLYLIHTEAFIVLAQYTLPATRTGLFTGA